MASDTPERILRINAVLDRTGLTRSTLYRKVADGTFPRQVKLSARCAGWHESGVNAWLRDPMCYRAEVRRTAKAARGRSTGQLPFDPIWEGADPTKPNR
jgi:prophage regulatory protein